MYYSRLITTAIIILLAMSVPAAPPPDSPIQPSTDNQTASINNNTFIDANKILMFVTNHGCIGRDLAGVFGYDYGTFYPYLDTNNISNGFLGNYSPLYAAGLWMGGKVDGETRVTVSAYASEYVPGPMVGGTYCPDDPSFKVYKLYADSLPPNANDDYLNWPFDQGAPADDYGNPLCVGDQTLWTVCNDANPTVHTNNAGETLHSVSKYS